MDTWGSVWVALASIRLANGQYFLRGDVVSGRLSIDELMRLADMGAIAQIDADGRVLVRQSGQPVFRTVGALIPRPAAPRPLVSPPESPTPEEAERRWWQRTHEIDRGQLHSEAEEAAMWREAKRLALQELGMTADDLAVTPAALKAIQQQHMRCWLRRLWDWWEGTFDTGYGPCP